MKIIIAIMAAALLLVGTAGLADSGQGSGAGSKWERAEQWMSDLMPHHAMSAEMAEFTDTLFHQGWHLPVMGILTAGLVLSTFFMQTMVRLRMAAIVTNVAFLGYGFVFELWPSVMLHGVLLPLNLFRLLQMRRTLHNIRTAAGGKIDLAKFLPFLHMQEYTAGTILFEQNDLAETAYYIVRGRVSLPNIPAEVGEGSLFGEVGVFAGSHRRTSTAICKTDVALYPVDASSITAAFYQNPKFAIYLISLISERLYVNHLPAEAANQIG